MEKSYKIGSYGDTKLLPLSVTANGQYDAPVGQGYNSINVKVVAEPEPPFDINVFYPLKFKDFKGDITELNKYLKAGGTKHLWTDMSYMFTSCSNLTTIPLIDTDSVIKMGRMFSYCSKLTTIPLINTSKVINMSYMFNSCSKLTTIPNIDTANVTDMSDMFDSCSNLTTIPLINTSKVDNMYYMFSDCQKLDSIPALDCSKVNNMSYMFQNCSSITRIEMQNINVNLDIHWCSKMSEPALREVINNLVPHETSGSVLTLGSTLIAKLTVDDAAEVARKNWTLA